MADSATRPGTHPILRPKMPELDLLRGVACLMVLIFHGFANHYSTIHLPLLPRLFVISTSVGWTGVNLFLVLSGFLITGILLDSKPRPDYFRRFYLRRALRILPAYYGVLAVILLLWKSGLIDSSQKVPCRNPARSSPLKA